MVSDETGEVDSGRMDPTTDALDANYGLVSYLRFRVTQFAAGKMTPEAVSAVVTMIRRRGIPDDGITKVFADSGIDWDPVTNVVRKP